MLDRGTRTSATASGTVRKMRFGIFTSDLVVAECNDGEQATCIITNDADDGEIIGIIADAGCITEVIAGSAVSEEALVASDDDGKGITAASGDIPVARAVGSASAGDKRLVIQFFGGVPQPAVS